MAPRRGHPERPVPADSPARALAEYLRELRRKADVTYRQMAATVPCRHNTLSQTVDGRRTGWPPIETFIKALRSAAPPGAVPDDAEQRARELWERIPGRPTAGRRPSGGPATAPASTLPTAVPPAEAHPGRRSTADIRRDADAARQGADAARRDVDAARRGVEDARLDTDPARRRQAGRAERSGLAEGRPVPGEEPPVEAAERLAGADERRAGERSADEHPSGESLADGSSAGDPSAGDPSGDQDRAATGVAERHSATAPSGRLRRIIGRVFRRH